MTAVNLHAHVRNLLAILAMAFLAFLASPALAHAAPLGNTPGVPSATPFQGCDISLASVADQPDDEFAQPFLSPGGTGLVALDRVSLPSALEAHLCRAHGRPAVDPVCGRGPPSNLHI